MGDLGLPLALGGAGAVSGILGYLSSMDANERAQLIYNNGFKQWMSINIPDPEQQKIVLQNFVSTGQLDPKLKSAIAQSPTEFNHVVADSGQKAAQNTALSQLQDLGTQGGLRLQDKAALQDAMTQSQVADRGNRNAIEANAARRGISDSGFDLASQLEGQQAVGDRNSKAGLQVAADAENRALAAIQGAGQLATQYRTQDVGEQQARASAADRINQFNTANLRDTNASNVDAQNAAQQYNLSQNQKISDENTNVANQQETYNKGLQQQQYENQLKRTAGATGQNNLAANNVLQGGQNTSNLYSNLGGAAIGGISAQAAQNRWDDYMNNEQQKYKNPQSQVTIR